MKKILSLIAVLMVSIMSFGQSLPIDLEGNTTYTVSAVASCNMNTIDIPNTETALYIPTTNLGGTLGQFICDTNTVDCMTPSDWGLLCTDSIDITKLAIGETMIRISAGSNSYLFIINVYDPNTASADEYAFDRPAMIVYPSPATSTTTIRFFAEKSDVPVYIFSLNGAMVFSETKSRIVGTENKIELDLTKFEKETYVVKVGNLVEKLIVE